MKTNKVIVRINVEALSIDSVPGLLGEVIEQLARESEAGHLEKDDGDSVEWETTRTPVEF